MRLGKYLNGLIAIVVFVMAMVVMAAMLVGCSSQKNVRTQVEEEQSFTRFDLRNVTKDDVDNGFSMSIRIDTTKMGIVRVVTVFDTEKAVMDNGEWKSPVVRVEREEVSVKSGVTEKDSALTQHVIAVMDSAVVLVDSLITADIETEEEEVTKTGNGGAKYWVWGAVFGLVTGLLIIAKLGNRFPFKM